MLKKAKAEAAAGATDAEATREHGEGHRRKAVLDSSRQIWLAGLGAFSRAQAGGHEGVRDAGQAGRAARDRDQAGGGRHGGGGARRGARRRQRRCSRWRAERGTSSSRCSRIASRARCRSSACTRKATSSGSPQRVDALVGSGQRARSRRRCGAQRRARPAEEPASGRARKTAKRARGRRKPTSDAAHGREEARRAHASKAAKRGLR